MTNETVGVIILIVTIIILLCVVGIIYYANKTIVKFEGLLRGWNISELLQENLQDQSHKILMKGSTTTLRP